MAESIQMEKASCASQPVAPRGLSGLTFKRQGRRDQSGSGIVPSMGNRQDFI